MIVLFLLRELLYLEVWVHTSSKAEREREDRVQPHFSGPLFDTRISFISQYDQDVNINIKNDCDKMKVFKIVAMLGLYERERRL